MKLCSRQLRIGGWALGLSTLAGCCPAGLPFRAGQAGSSDQAALQSPSPDGAWMLEQVWMHEGDWEGVDVDQATGDIYSLFDVAWHPDTRAWTAQVWRIGRGGNKRGFARIGAPGEPPSRMLRLARLTSGRAPGFVVGQPWSARIHAFDADGQYLWQHTSDDAVRAIWATDLDGDERDEVIIAAQGENGLRAVNADGSLRWKARSVTGFWGVVSLPPAAGVAPKVVGLDYANQVCVFDASGMLERRIAGTEGWSWDQMALAHASPGSAPTVVLTSAGALALTAVDPAGELLWRISERVGRTYVWALAGATDRPWAAVGLKDGRVFVYDVREGTRLASVMPGWYERLAWVPGTGDESPLLIAATTQGIKAYVMRPASDAPTNGHEEADRAE